MPDRYQELRDAIAAGPTRGPWMKATDWNRAAVMRSVEPYTRVVCTGNQNNADRFGAEDWSGSTWTDADYIAAADPDTISELLKERDALRDALGQYANPLNWSCDEHGIRRCWEEPGSSSPSAYNGFEAARAALADGDDEP